MVKKLLMLLFALLAQIQFSSQQSQVQYLNRPNPFVKMKVDILDTVPQGEFYITLTVQHMDISGWNETTTSINSQYYFSILINFGSQEINTEDIVRCTIDHSNLFVGFYCIDQTYNNQTNKFETDDSQDISSPYTWRSDVYLGTLNKSYFEFSFLRPLSNDDEKDKQFSNQLSRTVDNPITITLEQGKYQAASDNAEQESQVIISSVSFRTSIEISSAFQLLMNGKLILVLGSLAYILESFV
ncbi:UNKNOWN [Stylonychia lemnae]|uniref:Transmembrane protein n=1 Tax=Stylonychia lemnae TaxID=5949 RepID=A0A077ZXZ5_STYLE|nr:UNKNOWN [Stylonychia lemnae]|eukprot:CDW74477.1 UNKNOWN [Stylonychia lemnae]